MLTEVSMGAEWTQTDGRIGVLGNAASSVLTPCSGTHTLTAVRYSTRYTQT